MGDVLRIAAIATLDPHPERELAGWRDDVRAARIDAPEETRARLDGYERGEWLLVQLDLFALTARGDTLTREHAGSIGGCWFAVGADHQNRSHAREMVATNLEAVRDELARQGVDADLAELESVDIAVEIDPALAARLAPA